MINLHSVCFLELYIHTKLVCFSLFKNIESLYYYLLKDTIYIVAFQPRGPLCSIRGPLASYENQRVSRLIAVASILVRGSGPDRTAIL